MIGQKEKYYRFALGGRSRKFFLFFALMTTAFLLACSNSQSPETDNPFSQDDIEQNLYSSENQVPASTQNQQSKSSSSKIPASSSSQQSESSSSKTPASSSYIKEYLPLNDTEYPYAGLPRIVIETENHRQILDRETEIPAKLQVWGERAPLDEIKTLTIHGRGNTSWTDMPKKSYKIEFTEKYNILGMPKDQDWALIANYADKTLLKNFISYQLSETLKSRYTPRNKFVELYLNNKYQGVYLLTETIKVGKNRVNIPKSSSSFLAEFDYKHRNDDVYFTTKTNMPITIHYPHSPSSQNIQSLNNHISEFENFLKNSKSFDSSLNQWIDINNYIQNYWIQEFTKNPDAKFSTSVYFSWQEGKQIIMGPVWDFDLAFGGHEYTDWASYSNWHIKPSYWNKSIFSDTAMWNKAKKYWQTNQSIFTAVLDSIDIYACYLEKAANNNFKRWNILNDTQNRWHTQSFSSYSEAIDNLKGWIKKRINWISENI